MNKKPQEVLCNTKLQGLPSCDYTVVITMAVMIYDVAKESLKQKLNENISPKIPI